MKMTKFLQYLESRGKFRKKKICKVYTSIYIYISGKTVLSAFHYFYENILYTSEVITDSHITFIGKFFIISCLIQSFYWTKCNTLLKNIAIGSNSLKNLYSPHETKRKKRKKPPKMTKIKFLVIFVPPLAQILNQI